MKSLKSRNAFSLIELSIVILIIGILIAGVTQGSRLINRSKLSNARTLTQSSPVSSVKNLSIWIESSSETSFDDSESEDAAAISNWYDLNPQTSTKSNFTGTTTTRPTYRANIINSLPAILFDGTDDFMNTSNFINVVNGSTVFLVIKTPTTIAAKPIFSKRPSAAFGSSAPNIQVSTSSSTWSYCDGAAIVTNGTTCNYSAGTTIEGGKPYIVSITYNPNSLVGSGTTSATGVSFFENGAASTQTATTGYSPSTSVSADLFIGKDGTSSPAFYNSYLAELIIYDRTLKKEERQSIENYLGKKWGITMTTASY